MIKKKLLAGALACAMVLSVNTVAFAATTDITAPDTESGLYTSGELHAESTIEALEVKVTVPDSFAVAANPYKLDVTVDSETVNDQIISAAQDIVSDSNVDIGVGIKIGALPKENSSAVVATATTTAATKTKSIFSYLEVTGGTGKLVAKDKYDKAAGNQYVFPALRKGTGDKMTGYLEKNGVVTLAKKTSTSEDEKKATFQVKGDAATNPTVPWGATDLVTYYITYNFAPVVSTPAVAGSGS